MSKTNSQSTQAEECGVSKISAEEPSNRFQGWDWFDSLPLRTRLAITSEFDRLIEEHYEEKSLWAAQQHEDAHKICAYRNLIESLHEDARELRQEFSSIKDAYDLPVTHAQHLINEIIGESTEAAITEAIWGDNN